MKAGGIFSAADALGLGEDSLWTTPAKLDEPLVPPTDEKTPALDLPIGKSSCAEGEIRDVSGRCAPFVKEAPVAASSTKTNAMTLKEAAPWLVGAAVLAVVLVYKLK